MKLAVFKFKRGDYAYGVAVSLLFVALMAGIPIEHLEKFGFLIGTALGVFFLLTSGKAARQGNRNLGMFMFTAGLMMVVMALALTPKAVIAASAVDDMAPHVIAAIASYFAGIEEPDGGT